MSNVRFSVRIIAAAVALVAWAGLGIQRILAQCRNSNETELAATQRLIEDEERLPVLLWELRGERACYDRDWTDGETSWQNGETGIPICFNSPICCN